MQQSLDTNNDEELLPVQQFKHEIIDCIKKYPIIICIGETGSGKTTQIPQFCLDEGLIGTNLMVAVTQPRRVAATTIADHVSRERKSVLGEEVGYCIRFDDKTSAKTKIKYMTDGILVREFLKDPSVSKYGVIMLDEAHERSINTDILFGLVKVACTKRDDLRIIITSATLNTLKFGDYFMNAPILQIPGRIFPVDIYHSKLKQIMTISGPSNLEYVEAAAELALNIHMTEDEGHILIFLTGQDEIRKVCSIIEAKCKCPESLVALPLYSMLSTSIQQQIFKKFNRNSAIDFPNKLVSANYVRKIIVSTNIAETSITVPNVRFVIDSGYVKQKTYDPDRHIESLIVVPISQVAAKQRAGRAGRTSSGKCFRLYSSDCLGNMVEETIPEILRTNLANTILYLKMIGVEDVMNFDFIDRPSSSQFTEAMTMLHMLGAINDKGSVTNIGRLMSDFPLDPCMSRCLIAASDKSLDCLLHIATIAAMLSVESLWIEPKKGKDNSLDSEFSKVMSCHSNFYHPYGDHFVYLNVYQQWELNDKSQEWCNLNFIRWRALANVQNIRNQLIDDAKKAGLPVAKTHRCDENILEALVNGLYMNAARRASGNSNDSSQIYRTLPMKPGDDVMLLFLSPTSLARPIVSIVFNDLLASNGRLLARHICCVDEDLLTKITSRWRSSNTFLRLSKINLTSESIVLDTTNEIIPSAVELELSLVSPIDEKTVDDARNRYLARKRIRKI